MQYLNSLMKLNRRLTRSCRLGIALTSWTRLNFVKLAPAHTNACFGLTLSRENALTMRPGITGAAQIFVWTPTFQNDSTSPDKKKRGDNDEWRALPTLLSVTRNCVLMYQTSGENKTNCTNKINVVYTDGWCKIYADSLSPHSRRQVDSTACVIRSLLALNSE